MISRSLRIRVPTLIEPGFDEIHAGDLEGARIEAYRCWRDHHTLGDRMPHGESIDDALRCDGGRAAVSLTALTLFAQSQPGHC